MEEAGHMCSREGCGAALDGEGKGNAEGTGEQVGSTGLDTEGKAGPTEDGYVGEVQAGGTALGQGGACNRCHQHGGKEGRETGPCREGRTEKHSKTSAWPSEKCQKTRGGKGLATALTWGWQLLKRCPTLTSPLPSFLQP